jgi:hypothetical protein
MRAARRRASDTRVRFMRSLAATRMPICMERPIVRALPGTGTGTGTQRRTVARRAKRRMDPTCAASCRSRHACRSRYGQGDRG